MEHDVDGRFTAHEFLDLVDERPDRSGCNMLVGDMVTRTRIRIVSLPHGIEVDIERVLHVRRCLIRIIRPARRSVVVERKLLERDIRMPAFALRLPLLDHEPVGRAVDTKQGRDGILARDGGDHAMLRLAPTFGGRYARELPRSGMLLVLPVVSIVRPVPLGLLEDDGERKRAVLLDVALLLRDAVELRLRNGEARIFCARRVHVGDEPTGVVGLIVPIRAISVAVHADNGNAM